MADAVSGASSTSGSSSSTTSSSTSSTDPFASLNVSDFINLMITEMQNQDPLNPMDNSEIMQELGQLQSIDATTQLTTSLNSVLQGQNFATASSLIGKTIVGIDDSSNQVNGVVDMVTVSDGDVKLDVNGSTVSLDNISNILPTESN